MIKKIVVGTLIAILVVAVGVGLYDAAQGNSSLELPSLNVQPASAGGNGQGSNGQGQGQGSFAA